MADSILTTAINLQNSKINALQSKVDSLEKLSMQHNIAQDFFSDAIAAQSTLYLSIIGLIVLISVSTIILFLKRWLRIQTRELKQRSNEQVKQFDKLELQLSQHLNQLNERSAVTQTDVFFTFCILLIKFGHYKVAFQTALRGAKKSLIELGRYQSAIEFFNYIKNGISPYISADKTILNSDALIEIQQLFHELRNLNNPDILEIINEIEPVFYKEIYQK